MLRKETKAECITKTNGISPSFYHTEYGASINTLDPEEEYPQVCFNYIHENPVKGGLVITPEDWEFSSYRDYCELRNGKLVSRELAERHELRVKNK